MRLASLSGLLLMLLGCGGGSADQPPGAAGSASGGMMPSEGGGGGATGGAGAGAGAAGARAGSAGAVTSGSGPVNDDDAPSHEVTFEPTDELLLNPERGFYASANLVDAPDLSDLRASGVTLVHSYVRLDDYRTSDLPASLLEQVAAGFERAREAGVKVILRFAYNFGPYPDSEPDAPKSWVLQHIQQLEPLLAANSDVIAVVQAGFIGAWGEWHTSTNGLTDPAARQEILETLVDAVPASRAVQLRYPAYKKLLYGEPLTAATAFMDSYAARVGHHNDCFVSSDTDVGTYPEAEVDAYRDYVGADSVFVPMGGETCALSPPRSECPSALLEMEKLHFTYINREFHEGVVQSWQACLPEMQRRLGYRLSLVSANVPQAVKPGGSFTLRVELENSGFAAPINARPVLVVLSGAEGELTALLADVDVRRWLEGAELQARLRVPSSAKTGPYRLALRLPDAALTLQQPEYCLRFANQGTWDETSCDNVLGNIEIAEDAAGSSVADASAFEVLE
jgi:hypothetical protein